MLSIRAGWKAAALTWPLFVLVLVLFPVVAVHGVGGALTHGHPDSVSGSTVAGGHAASGDSADGVHSFTVAAQQESHGHNDVAAADTEAAPADAATSHAHADCLSMAAPTGLSSLLLWSALLVGGIRAPTPPPSCAASILRIRGRVVRFWRTRLRLAELSVLQV